VFKELNLYLEKMRIISSVIPQKDVFEIKEIAGYLNENL